MNLNREKRIIFLDIDKTRNNNKNRNNWSDSAASSVQQCAYATDKDHWFDMSIRDLTWATVATKLATLPPILGIL